MADRAIVLKAVKDRKDPRRLEVDVLYLYELRPGNEIKNKAGTVVVTQPTSRMDPVIKAAHQDVGIFTPAEVAAFDSGNLVMQRAHFVLNTDKVSAAAAQVWDYQAKLGPRFIADLREEFRFLGVDVPRP